MFFVSGVPVSHKSSGFIYIAIDEQLHLEQNAFKYYDDARILHLLGGG